MLDNVQGLNPTCAILRAYCRVLRLYSEPAQGTGSTMASLQPERGTFLHSLVTNVPVGAVLLDFGDAGADPQPVSTQTQELPPDVTWSVQQSPPLCSPTDPNDKHQQQQMQQGAVPTMLPTLDSFVLACARARRGPRSPAAQLRRWNLFGLGQPFARLSYTVEGDRFCGRVGVFYNISRVSELRLTISSDQSVCLHQRPRP